MSIHVQLDRFEGPLGLLLHLIREQEMDIFNINIHHITRQYLEYIKTMRRLDLEVAGEFVAMAATLLHIKSRMLLPQYGEDGEEIKEDPRKELVQKLLEYKMFRELSADLYKRPLLGRDVFARGEVEDVEAAEEGELVLEENPLYSLIHAYRTALRNMKKTVHRVIGEMQSIATRILEMRTYLQVGRKVMFSELITASSEHKGSQVLVTFLALLELGKMGFISVFQSEAFADIHIEAKQEIDRDAVLQVESYDSVNAAITAEKIMSESAQLSLTEPEVMLEGEEAPVVHEAFADAATDADIEAEEALIAAQDQVMGLDQTTEQDLEQHMEIAAAEASAEVLEEAPVFKLAVDGEAAESILTLDFVGDAEPEMNAESEMIVAPEAVAEPELAAEPEMTPEPIAIEAAVEPTTESVVDQNVNSAVSAALSAFDAFKDDDDKPPEVDV